MAEADPVGGGALRRPPVRVIEEQHRAPLSQRRASDAKLRDRGRWLTLDVQADDVAAVEIACRSEFHVVMPLGLDGVQKLAAIRGAFGRCRGRPEGSRGDGERGYLAAAKTL